jgi:cell shape-determining protein MreD
VSNPVHAIIMGVTMHYTQYLYLTHKVFKGRNQDKIIQTSKLTYIGVISFYALVMTILSLFGKSSDEMINYLIIIPIIGQMLHFYLDSQLWKASSPHNRENVFKYIK